MEYFQFIRDFVSQFKSTFTSGMSSQSALYTIQSDSESAKVSKLVQLTRRYNHERESLGDGQEIDMAEYMLEYGRICDEGDSEVLDIHSWKEQEMLDLGLSIIKFSIAMSIDMA